jgi:RNA polymerase sigma-70 factor (ECF subfamily)
MTTHEHDRFVILLEEHRKILFKVANTYCRNPDDRRDLIQEITVQLWRSFGRYDDRLRFSTWMYRVALNVAISFHRGESRRTRHTVPVDESVLEIAAPEIETDDELRRLHELIDQLEDLNKALILLYLDDNSYDTIAEILGITTTNVATKISRIKQKLRREFAVAREK